MDQPGNFNWRISRVEEKYALRLRQDGIRHHSRTSKLGDSMFTIRTYLAALTLMFLVSAVATKSIGALEASIVACLVIYTSLAIRREPQALRSLAARVGSRSRGWIPPSLD